MQILLSKVFFSPRIILTNMAENFTYPFNKKSISYKRVLNKEVIIK